MLGVIFDMFGWTACVAGIAASLVVAALLPVFLRTPIAPEARVHYRALRHQDRAVS